MPRHALRSMLLTLGCLAVVAALVQPAAAQPSPLTFGVRAGETFHARAAFLGVELLVPLGHGWKLDPNAEVALVNPGHLVTGNLDLSYEISAAGPFRLWAGGGPAIVFRQLAVKDVHGEALATAHTDAGLNLLAGIGLRRQRLLPYLQAKVLLSNTNEYVLAFGVRF
jgi:hypothetical protein